MRVTQDMLTQQLLYNITNVNQRIESDQEKLSTGKTLNQASDNPLAVSQDMAINSALSKTKAYQDTISSGQSWVQSTMYTTQSMITNLQSVQQSVLQALNTSNMNASELTALVDTARQSIMQVYSSLDTKQGDDYLYGGALTTTPPATDAQGAYLSYGANGELYNGVGTGVSPDGVQQRIPPSSIASGITGTLALSTGTAYELSFQATGTTSSSGSSQPAFSGQLTLINPTNGSIIASGTMVNMHFGSAVTLTSASGTLVVTLGNLVDSTTLSSGSQYSQTDNISFVDNSVTDGRKATISYHVDDGIDVPVNLTAAELFHTIPLGASRDLQSTLSAVVDDLTTAANALQQGSSSGNAQQVYETSITNLKSDLTDLQVNTNHLVDANSSIGSQSQRMTAIQNQVSQYVQTLTDQKSNLEDANMAEVITQFSTDQSVYQAALQMGAKVILPSLVNFL